MSQGPTSLWYGFVPFLLEAFPYDVAELGVYSQLRELHNEALKSGSGNRCASSMPEILDCYQKSLSHRLESVAAALPSSTWDALLGAAAGATAVLISMPFDNIKTYIQTTNSLTVAAGPLAQMLLFASTGRTLVLQRGLPSLFIGVVPRLVQQVPSSTICWWSVEACQKALQPFAEGRAASGGTHC